MKAIVWKSPKTIQVEERTVPEPGPGQALVRMRAFGICGSDIKLYEHGVLGTLKPTRPFIMGHEGTGTVARVGEGAAGIPVGLPVCINPQAACQTCFYCLRGEQNLCEHLDFKSVTGEGVFSEYVLARTDQLVPLPEGFDLCLASLIEPLSVAVQSSRAAAVTPEEGVLLYGAGTIGLLTLEVLRCLGASRVMVVDVEGFALEQARHLGAAFTLNPREQDLDGAVREAFGRRGPDVVIEASGSAAAQSQAFEIVRPGGRLVLVGISPEPDTRINVNRLVRSNLRVFGTVRTSGDAFTAAAHLMTGGQVNAGCLISRVFPFEAAAEAFEYAIDKRNRATKVLLEIEPGGTADRLPAD